MSADLPASSAEGIATATAATATAATTAGDDASQRLGLTSAQAAQRLQLDGPNALPEPRTNAALLLASKFWGPVPWLLEAAIVLEAALGNAVQAGIIAVLVIVDAVLAYRQEGSARAALDLLRQRLHVEARVLRDGTWSQVSSEALVTDDVVYVRKGDFVPADLRVVDGQLSLDQSALTGESAAVEVAAGGPAYSGSVVLRGEATAVVTATGARSYFGRTAELVSTARAPGNLQKLIFGFVQALLVLDAVIVVAVLGDGFARHIGLAQLLPFAVILVVAAVPIALPTTFTLASALGSRELAERGVLVTRLAAIEEAASMEVLCSDKTGTITENHLVVDKVHAYPPYDDQAVVSWAAAASDEATADPLDIAVLNAAKERGTQPEGARQSFTPFDPSIKRCEAVISTPAGARRAVKGAPQVVSTLVASPPSDLTSDVAALAAGGARVLGVAEGPVDGPLSMVGLVSMDDPPRPSSAPLIRRLRNLGVRVVMVTGDNIATARAIARRVGIGDRAVPAAVLRNPAVASNPAATSDIADATQPSAEVAPRAAFEIADVYAEVLPEDKLRLISLLQEHGTVVGMTGDGVNDAPALRKAEVGIAVANATDVAKSAASMVLTEEGLDNVVAAVEVSRRIHERMLSYTLNKIIKTLQVSLFLGLGLLFLGKFVTTPLLVVLLLLTNNIATMSLATDRVGTPRYPERWTVRSLLIASVGLSLPILALSFGVWFAGADGLGLGVPALQTLTFVWLVTSAQATIYSVRERHHFWHSAPSLWLAASSALDLVVVVVLAWQGWLMTPIGGAALGLGVGAGFAFLLVADVMKTTTFRLAHLSPSTKAYGPSTSRASQECTSRPSTSAAHADATTS
ncbi:MAG: plasma-membrane proton-efflux P-type ATPase [Acidimicrobiales bacterium]